MTDAMQEFIRRCQILQKEFVQGIPADIESIHKFLSDLTQQAEGEKTLQKLIFVIHKYHGMAHTFGFTELSLKARTLESELLDISAKHDIASQQPLVNDHCRDFTAALKACAEAPLPTISMGIQPESAADKQPREGAVKHTVLVADDDASMVHLLTHKLKHHGYKVMSADNGQAALEMTIKHKPNLVLMDGLMPDMDGLTVLEKLKAGSTTRNIPVIIITARRQEKNMKAAFALGAADYIVKPFQPDDLLIRVGQVLGEL